MRRPAGTPHRQPMPSRFSMGRRPVKPCSPTRWRDRRIRIRIRLPRRLQHRHQRRHLHQRPRHSCRFCRFPRRLCPTAARSAARIRRRSSFKSVPTVSRRATRFRPAGTIYYQPFPTQGVTYRLQPLAVDIKGMAAGTYKDTLTLTNTISNKVVTVAVTLTLTQGPTISSLSVIGVQAGSPGFTLTVNGTNFSGICTIHWNGTAVTTTYVSAVQLTAQIPASLITSPGSVAITVATADGAPSNSLSLAIEQYSISSISPTRASVGDAGFTLSIAGSGFVAGSTVNFGT